jgi:hypothetical protein
MTELIRNDALAFRRHGIVQATGGSVNEALAEEMVERFPEEVIQSGWEELTRAEDFGDELRAVGIPMLLRKARGLLDEHGRRIHEFCAGSGRSRGPAAGLTAVG